MEEGRLRDILTVFPMKMLGHVLLRSMKTWVVIKQHRPVQRGPEVLLSDGHGDGPNEYVQVFSPGRALVIYPAAFKKAWA